MYPKTEAQARLLAMADRLAPRFAERAERHDRDGTFPFENVEELRDAGYLTAALPVEFGGGGHGLADIVLAQIAMARGDGSTALAIGMHQMVCGSESAARDWPEAARRRIFGDVVREGALLNYIATEPDLGSPAGGGRPTTTARRDGSGRWRINGRKTFSTMAPALTYFITYVAYDDGSGEVGRVAVHRDRPGLRIEETWDTIGMRATGSHDVVYEDVPVDDDDILTRYTLGARRPSTELAWFPLTTAAAYFGVAEAAQAYAVRFAKERVPSGLGRAIATLPYVRERIGQMEALRLAARSLLLETASDWDAYPDHRTELAPRVAAAKRLATNSAIEMTEIAMRIVGGVGLQRSRPLERYLRDVRGGLIHPPIEARALDALAASALEEPAGGE